MSERFSAGGQSTFAILCLSFRCIGYCEEHASIGAAATEIPSQAGANLLDACAWMLPNECRRGHDKSRRAKTALLRVVFHKSFLHRVELIGLADSFDCGDVVSLCF